MAPLVTLLYTGWAKIIIRNIFITSRAEGKESAPMLQHQCTFNEINFALLTNLNEREREREGMRHTQWGGY